MNKCLDLEYDVVLSFAGEDRSYVEKTANILRKSGVKVFYDMYEDTNLWGKDLYQHLDDIYQNKAKYAILFISENYSKKLWTNHELKSAQARAFSENTEYILPARFDDTEIPGVRKTIGYVSLKDLKPFQFAKKILKKLGALEPTNFLPNNITFIKEILHSIFDDLEDSKIEEQVNYIFDKLKLTTEKERKFLIHLATHTCRHDISEDLHEDITLLERVTGFNRTEIIEIVKSLSNLGFEYKIEISNDNACEEGYNQFDVELLHLRLIARDGKIGVVNLTLIFMLMCFAPMSMRCETCLKDALLRLDFTDLSSKADEEIIDAIESYIPDNYDDDSDGNDSSVEKLGT